MRWLLQFGAMLLMLVTLVVPVSEALDRWDAPGLTHDTEFQLFVIVLLFALVLLVSRLVATLASTIRLILLAALAAPMHLGHGSPDALDPAAIPPLSSPPLRI